MKMIWCKVTWKNGFVHQYEVVDNQRKIDENKKHLQSLRWVECYELSDKKFKLTKK